MSVTASGPTRRAFLASGGALSLGGCVHCSFPEPTNVPATIGDAHAHFFNAADLPVAGFVKFVLLPRYFPELPDFADAIVDIIAFVAKTLALTARAEARQLGAGRLSFSDPPGAEQFGRAAAEAHRRGLAGEAPIPDVDRLEADELAAALRSDQRAASHRALAALLGGERPAISGGAPALDAGAFAAIASDPLALRHAPTDVADLQCPTRDARQGIRDAGIEARTLLRWAYLMCRPRCVHVEEYLGAIATDGARVADAVNLLVDYDKWLNDAPRRGSETADQVAYWTRYGDISAAVPGRIRLHNFAGYDPLRDAEERCLEKRSVPSFDMLRQWAIAGRDPASRAPRRIAGFKIYPPMGFRPDSNAAIDIPDARGGKAIRRRWGARLGEIGIEIDRSLDRCFDFCVMEDVPVLTHARESNIALANHGDDPSPRHWLARTATLRARFPDAKPLRLCIGHFDMFACPESPMDDGAVLLEALKRNRAREARIYFDLGFDDRILAGQGRALLDEIGAICERAGDDGDYILFGSDWIMLANQANADRYLALAQAAAEASPFWRTRRDKLFRLNLLRFLDPAAD